MKLMTVSEVCDVLRISRSALYNMWLNGVGPSYLQIGGQRRVRGDVLEEWINRQTPGNANRATRSVKHL